MDMAMDWQPFLLFPSLHRPDITPEVSADFFPGLQPFLR